MRNEINHNLSRENLITTIMQSNNFLNLDHDLQNKIIDSVNYNKEKDGGVAGRFLGNKTTNASVNFCFILCCLLIIIVVIDIIHSYYIGNNINMKLVNTVIPVITLSMGYIFGKSFR